MTEAMTQAERPITMTPKAIEMGKRTLAEATEPTVGLRIGVKGGGCSGYYYVFELATKIRERRDRLYDFDGLRVIIDDRSAELLRGSKLDWEKRLMGYGFKWENPNSKGDCGCGQSFTVE